MTATLYGFDGSGSAAVEAALVLAGQPFRRVTAASWAGGSAHADLRRLNPLGQIPTLVWPDGTVMTESAAILIELGWRHPGSGLLPSAPAERAQALRGLVFIAANCDATIGVIDFPDRVLDAPSADEAARIHSHSRARLHQLWSDFADQFPPPPAQPFYGGHQPGGLDLLASVVSRWSGSRPHLAAQRPALSALVERVALYPALRRLMARHWPDPPAAP